jgi:hypothetical protein
MSFSEIDGLMAIVTASAGVGALHTLLGPDHYLPLLALGRARRWSSKRTLGVTAVAGLAHCLASFVLVLVALWFLQTASAIEGLQALRGDIAAYLLVGLGFTLILAGLRRSRRKVTGPVSTVWLLLVFVLGPCEWLVPGATAVVPVYGLLGALAVSLAFTAATVLTMVVTVGLGLRLLPARGLFARHATTAAGALIALSGGLILLGA